MGYIYTLRIFAFSRLLGSSICNYFRSGLKFQSSIYGFISRKFSQIFSLIYADFVCQRVSVFFISAYLRETFYFLCESLRLRVFAVENVNLDFGSWDFLFVNLRVSFV
jgi:hypothetical protein